MTKIIGHRGVPSLAPENTTSSFLLAIKLKLDYFELDVRETMDKELVTIHMDEIKKMTGHEGAISKMKYTDLKKLIFNYPEKFGNNFLDERLPKLSKVLDLAKGKIKVAIELKADNIEKKVLDLVKRKRMIKNTVIISYNLNSLKKLRKSNKNIGLVYLSDKLNENTIDQISDLGINYIAIGRGGVITQNIVAYGLGKNVKLWKFTIDDKEEMNILIKENADGIISNFPQKMIEVIQSCT